MDTDNNVCSNPGYEYEKRCRILDIIHYPRLIILPYGAGLSDMPAARRNLVVWTFVAPQLSESGPSVHAMAA